MIGCWQSTLEVILVSVTEVIEGECGGTSFLDFESYRV